MIAICMLFIPLVVFNAYTQKKYRPMKKRFIIIILHIWVLII